jgi:hypothetical protein
LAYHMKNSTEKDKKRIISKVLLGDMQND